MPTLVTKGGVTYGANGQPIKTYKAPDGTIFQSQHQLNVYLAQQKQQGNSYFSQNQTPGNTTSPNTTTSGPGGGSTVTIPSGGTTIPGTSTTGASTATTPTTTPTSSGTPSTGTPTSTGTPGTSTDSTAPNGTSPAPLTDSNALDPRALASTDASAIFQRIMDETSNDANASQFNTSANRLRERLDSANSGMNQQATDRNLSRGFGNSGAQDSAIQQNNIGTQGQYAQGLSSLSDAMEKNRLTGLGISNDAAKGYAGNANAIDQMLHTFLTNRDAQNTQKQIAEGNNKNALQVTGLNNLNSQQLAQLTAQMQAWIAAMGVK